jgi:hypothetical protein
MNEALFITQIIEKNGRSYIFMVPMGAPYADLYDVLSEFSQENKTVHEAKLAEEEKKSADLSVEKSESNQAV